MTKLTMHPIRTDADYRAVMARINALAVINPLPGTSASDELEVLSLLVRSYEDARYPIGAPTLDQALLFRAEQMGLSVHALDHLFGGSGRRSEVLAGKRALSKTMAARLRAIGVPDALLLHLLIDGNTRTNRAGTHRQRRTVRSPTSREKTAERKPLRPYAR